MTTDTLFEEDANISDEDSGLTIKEIVQVAHLTALDKGWHDKDIYEDGAGDKLHPAQILAFLALIASEVSEAVECVRLGQLEVCLDPNGKPVGFPTELADVVIRIGDLCGLMNISLGSAIKTKLAFNKTRTHRHGGKLA